MIARRFGSIGWVVAIAVAALAFYLVSLRVANERGALADTDRAIAAAERDLRRLSTELATRGSLHQLDRWNRKVLALTSPKVSQYIADQHQLAAYTIDGGPAAAGAAGEARVMQASATGPAPAADRPRIEHAVIEDAAPRPATPIQTAAAEPLRIGVARPAPVLQKASYTPGLLGDATLGDLERAARDEAGGR